MYQSFFQGGGGGWGAFVPSWLWLAPLGYAENSILHVNQFKPSKVLPLPLSPPSFSPFLLSFFSLFLSVLLVSSPSSIFLLAPSFPPSFILSPSCLLFISPPSFPFLPLPYLTNPLTFFLLSPPQHYFSSYTQFPVK